MTILNTDEKIIKAINKYSFGKSPYHRYASFDYCYGYFNSFKNKKLISSEKNIEMSCLHLVSYLASWGMYRGSSFLLREKSIKYFEDLIRWISNSPREYWKIDVSNYDTKNISVLLEIYSSISGILNLSKNRAPILATKIMLGVFGNTPAYDENFRQTFSKYFNSKPGFTRYNEESLKAIKKFYNENNRLIDNLSLGNKLLNFITSKENEMLYTRAKIIDMIGFGYSFHPKTKNNL